MQTKSDQRARLSQHDTAAQTGAPGAWQAMLAGLVASGLIGGWALPKLLEPTSAVGATPVIGDVSPAELSAADNTLAGLPAAKEQLKQADRACGAHLAQVTVSATTPGQVTLFRLWSGGYVSPEFTLRNVPLRVALPYPAPYAVGHGQIGVAANGAHVVLALSPAVTVVPQPGIVVQNVHWTPDPRCDDGAPP